MIADAGSVDIEMLEARVTDNNDPGYRDLPRPRPLFLVFLGYSFY